MWTTGPHPLSNSKRVEANFPLVLGQDSAGLSGSRDNGVTSVLVAAVPVSVHGRSSHSGAANQVSNMFVRLPVDLADPREQLASIRRDTHHAKDVHEAIGADMIGDAPS